ncbi:MAG: SsrA-binding protein SmpB [Candidatus Helarchaeota archaeon]|nr:SsrA-binding protein SmpB [Candidatus Helarchaeota archaeon]
MKKINRKEIEKIVTTNRKARHDYHIIDSYESGIILKGTEVKSIRNGNVNLKDSYAVIKDGEVFLLNMHVSHYKQGNIFNHVPLRDRKLLLNKREIKKLLGKVQEKGMTLVPLKLYFKKGRVKVELALAKGKKVYDKRKEIARRDFEREKLREWKGRI